MNVCSRNLPAYLLCKAQLLDFGFFFLKSAVDVVLELENIIKEKVLLNHLFKGFSFVDN